MYWRSKRFVSTSYYNWGAILIEGEDASSDEQIKERLAKNAAVRARNRVRMNADNSDGALADAALGVVTFAGSLLEPLEEAEPSFSCAVYGDGVLIATVYRINQIERLPGKRMYTTLEIEIRGNQRITGLTVAGTPEDIAGGA